MGPPKRLHSPQKYTVGWIAALDKELAAARAALDEIHQKPESFTKHPKDSNNYTWGRIGEHNVVIASLPAGRYGAIAASVTAASMWSSLPHLRFGLMVGIGAGIPRLEDNVDIRLGDVVVSHPAGTSPGVVQYDLGKLTSSGKFERTGCLDHPPEVLLNGLATLKAHHMLEESRVPEILDDMIKRYPKLGVPGPDGSGAFVYQGKQNDRLFEAATSHKFVPKASGQTIKFGETCLYCDPTKEVKRKDRSAKPHIHYGVIASGNSVIKTGIGRDSLLKRLDHHCICFEMEAAGLMNHFPCLIVRGICDYADTHKNDRWQNYAAATAAAFTKELLQMMDGEDVEEAPTMDEIISQVRHAVTETRDIVNETRLLFEGLNVSQSFQAIRDWLRPSDPSVNYNKAIQKRHKDSCKWFIECTEFAKWKGSESSFLWLHGMLGCGKTVLSSVVIKSLKDDELCDCGLLYFYFDFNDTSKQSLENAVRSLVYQLYQKSVAARRVLDSLHASLKDKQPGLETLLTTLQSMVQEVGEVWVVLDALDECTTRKNLETGGIVSWIKEFLNFPQSTVHLLATSRQEQDLDFDIKKWAQKEDVIPIQTSLVSDDIEAYVRTMVREHESLERWREQPDIQDEIESALISNSGGMFRWVWCQLDALQCCLDRISLRKALASLPKTLDETYDRVLANIPAEYDGHTKRILQFLTFAERPLRVEEVAHIIAVNLDRRPHFDSENTMPLPMEISKYCSSLVTVTTREDSESETTVTEMQLAHFSVKEYLTSTRLTRYPQCDFQVGARVLIAKVCLVYLLEVDSEKHWRRVLQPYAWDTLLRSPDFILSYPLAKFAAQNWAPNARLAQATDKDLHALMVRFFSCARACETSYSLHSPEIWFYHRPTTKHSPLYYASLEGFVDIVTEFLDRGSDVNAKFDEQSYALPAAAHHGHQNVVQILLSRGADMKADDKRYGTALMAASHCGHEDIVQLVLSQGADVNFVSRQGDTALHDAAVEGHDKIIRILLDHGAGINAIGRDSYYTPLSIAVEGGFENAVEILLENGADVNAITAGPSALQTAVIEGHDEIVQSLIDYGADIHLRFDDGTTILQLASRHGYEDIVHTLLSSGAKINARGGEYGSALQAAAANGHLNVVKYLRQHGAYLNAKGKYQSALIAASENQHENVAQFLRNCRKQ